MNALLAVSTFVFPLITFPYISRVLLAAGTGRVQFATSLIAYFTMFAQLGIPTYGIRACAKVRDNREELTRTAHELLFINIIMSLISYGLLAVGIALIPRLSEDRTLICVVSISIFLNAIGMEWLYKAMEQYTYIAIRSVVFKIIGIVAMFLLIHTENDYVLYGAITIFASGASGILNFVTAGRFIGFKPVGGYNITRHLKVVLIFFAMSCATTVYTNLDVVMLGLMKTNADNGYYAAAVKVKTVLVALVTSLGEVLLPRVSYYIKNEMMDEFRRVSKKAMNFVMLASLPLSLYFILFAQAAIMLLSGEEFLPAVPAMQIIMPTVFLIGVTNLMGIEILIPLGRERSVLISVAIGAGVDLVLNLILIPQLGAAGAAIGTLAAEICVLAVQAFMLRSGAVMKRAAIRDADSDDPISSRAESARESFPGAGSVRRAPSDNGFTTRDLFRGISYWKIVAALAVGTALCIWVRFVSWGAFPKLVVSAILFFGAYSLVLFVLRERLTRELLRQITKRLHR